MKLRVLRAGSIFVALMVSLSALGACSSQTLEISEDISIPVLNGSSKTDSCDAIVRRDLTRDIVNYGCVAMPNYTNNRNGKNWDSDYLSAAEKEGWTRVGGAVNVHWLEKKADENCNYKLGMMGTLEKDEDWNAYMRGDEPDVMANLVFVFFMLPEIKVCGDDREM